MTSELDLKARQLIGLAMQGERRLPRQRERVRRGVLAVVAAPVALSATEGALAATKAATVSGGVAGTKAALVSAAVWLKVAPLVVVAAAAGAVGYERLQPTRASTPSVQIAPPAVSLAAATAAAAPRSADIAPAIATEPAPSAPVAATRGVKANRASLQPTEEAPPVASAPPSLSFELDALQRAQRALNSGDAARALAELDGVKGRALAAERTALEVFALCRLGNTAAARQKAAVFRQLAPESPLQRRVKASCAGE